MQRKPFPCDFQFAPRKLSCRNGTKSPPSPPLVQCCFGLTVHMCISCVTANNIAVGEREMVLICDGKHSCQDECKNRYFCNVSQQVLSGVVACTSPKVIFRSLKKILISRICLQFFFKLSSQKTSLSCWAI